MQYNLFYKMPDNRTGYRTRDDYAFLSKKIYLVAPQGIDTDPVYDGQQPEYSLLNQYSQDCTRLYVVLGDKNVMIGSFQGRAVLALMSLDTLELCLFECTVEHLKECILSDTIGPTLKKLRKQHEKEAA